MRRVPMHMQPTVGIALQAGGTKSEMQAHAEMAQVVGQLQGQFGIETLQQPLALHEQMHAATQRLQQAGDFNRDIAATDNRHLCGRMAEIEEIVGHFAVLGTVHVRAQWMRTGGDHDVLGGHRHAVAAHEGVPVLQHAALRNHHHAILIEPAPITGMDVGDVALPMRDQFLPRQCRPRHIETERAGQCDFSGQIGCQPHRLLRYAAQIDAGATQLVRLHDRHAGAVFCRAKCRRQSTGTAAQDHHVVVVTGAHANRSAR